MPSRYGSSENPGTSAPIRAAMLVALVGPSLNLCTLPAALPSLSVYFGGGTSGTSVAQAAMALPFLGLTVGGLGAGKTIDLFGLRKCLLLAAMLFAAGGVGCALAWGAPFLLACCFLIGITGAVLASGLTMLTGVLLEGGERVRMVGFQAAASDVASILGALIAGGLAQFFGWRAPFCIFVVFGVLVLLLIFRQRLPTTGGARHGHGLLSVARMAPGTYAAGFCLFFLTASVGGVLPFHLAANGLGTPGSRAIVLTAVPVFATVASAGYALNRGRIGDRTLVVIAFVAAAGGFASFAFWSGGLVVAALSAAAIGLAVGISSPMAIRTMLRQIPSDLHGYSMGLFTAAIFFGGFGSPLVLGGLYQHYGAMAVFMLCAGIAVAGGLAALVRLNWPQKQRVADPQGSRAHGHHPLSADA